MAAATFVLAGCNGMPQDEIAPASAVREVRVLLADSAPAARIRINAPFQVTNGDSDTTLSTGKSLDWTRIAPDAPPVELLGGRDALPAIAVSSERYGALELALENDEGNALPLLRYPGRLLFEPQPDGRLRILNLVDIESYIAGVVPNEVWPTFHDESLKAQAVAARTYALYQMADRAQRPYDVRANEGDQVYRGIRADEIGDRVRKAVNATRGVVLCWQSPDGLRIFPAYYSAACGGITQSARRITINVDASPLRGGVQCDYCKIARGEAYRWEATTISKDDLFSQLVARKPDLSKLEGVDAVEVTESTRNGRIGTVTIRGKNGESVDLRGEAFRLIVGSRVMRSTACKLVDAGDNIRLEEGQGFGHGVGLCQWGMEGQAREGRSADDILHFYYPGAILRRAY